jgi:signal peptidase I
MTKDQGWPAPTKHRGGTALIVLASIAALLILPFFVLRVSGFVGGPGIDLYDIPSNSMVPTLMVGDYMLTLSNVYRDSLPPRGQVIVFKYPADGKTDYVKRVIGLPGDRIQLRAGILYLNDQPVQRTRVDYALDTSDGTLADLTIYRETLPGGASYLSAESRDDAEYDNTNVFVVPEGNVFVLGDSRDHSNDSRMFGNVPLSLLRDKPVLIYWSKDTSRIGAKIE